MGGKWRLFRQDAGRVSGPPPVFYVGLFTLCMALGMWSVSRYGAVVIWPANGVILAALLQLHRRPAIAVLTVCLAINLGTNVFRGDSGVMLVMNAVLNMGEVLLAGLIARRFCGAALDLRRPARLARFAFLAAAPSVALSALIAVSIADVPKALIPFTLGTYFSMEVLGLLIVTPTLLLMVRGHRFVALNSVPVWEKGALLALLAAVTIGVFAQGSTPLAFLIFPPLLLIAFRLSPSWAAFAVMLVAVIGAGATLTGHGPIPLTQVSPDPALAGVAPVLRVMPVFYLFMAAVLCVALPASTVLTERRRLEARLQAQTIAAHEARRRAESADAAKSRFLAMMSHEMRTPLNGVAGFASLLAARPDLDAEAQRQIGLIRHASDGLLMLVDDVLDFSHGGVELNPAAFSVSAAALEAIDLVRPAAEAKGLSLEVHDHLGHDMRHLGDARRVRQALHLLLVNAVKFTAEGGVLVTLDADDDGIVVRVADTGPGISPEQAPTLFQPFHQGDASINRQHAGAGIGLALCKHLIGLMGGEIGVDSRFGEGSTFWFRAPLPPLDDRRSAPDRTVVGRAPRVLVVDDHAVNREVAGLMLTAVGCDVTQVCDGDEAVEAARYGDFDLILMDVRMPRMDGLAATRAIRALEGGAAAVPIVAMTADVMPEDVARCLAAGMNAHLAKPVTQALLIETVAQSLDTAQAPAVAA